MNKTKVGILYGGRSVEHTVSINSARNIEKYIDRERFEVFLIGLSKTGRWRHTKKVEADIEKGDSLQLALDPERPRFVGERTNIALTVDVIFSALHGTGGEDGDIQGLLNSMQIPFVGSGTLGSSMAMNKLVSKQLMHQAGIPVAAFRHYRARQRKNIDFNDLANALGLPFMVKAVNLGSSVGVSKVEKEVDFERALDEAFRYDDSLLIEQYITGRELECAVLDGTPPEASAPGEVILQKDAPFYTFDAKYNDPAAARIEVPAKLPTPLVERIKTYAIEAFERLHCQDLARVDLFVTDKEDIYINEVNTLPGFTDASMFPLMWRAQGLSFRQLITRLIGLALQRSKEQSKITREFLDAQAPLDT